MVFFAFGSVRFRNIATSRFNYSGVFAVAPLYGLTNYGGCFGLGIVRAVVGLPHRLSQLVRRAVKHERARRVWPGPRASSSPSSSGEARSFEPHAAPLSALRQRPSG
jgi:hypothetical protein